MIYPNQQYKPNGGRGKKNEVKQRIAEILKISPRHARNLINKGMTIELATQRASKTRKDQGIDD
jgi:hypothetical protein